MQKVRPARSARLRKRKETRREEEQAERGSENETKVEDNGQRWNYRVNEIARVANNAVAKMRVALRAETYFRLVCPTCSVCLPSHEQSAASR